MSFLKILAGSISGLALSVALALVFDLSPSLSAFVGMACGTLGTKIGMDWAGRC